MYLVYVLKNSKTNKKYIGQTNNLELRLKRHNGLLPSKKKSFTNINRADGKWIVIYKQEYNTREEAVKREKYLKSHVGREWLEKSIDLGR